MRRSHALILTMLSATLSPLALTVGAASLPDTGQSLCDNGANTLVTCSNTNTGDASTMPGQDGRFGRDPANTAGAGGKTGGGSAGFDYNKIANDGTPLAANATLGSATTDWACTQDNLTGLTWEVKVNDSLHLRHNGWSYSWYDSNTGTNGGDAGLVDSGVMVGSDNCLDTARCDTEQYVADVNAASLCGYTDWRLPSKRELQTITQLGNNNPAVDATYFPNTSASPFWSAKSDAQNPTDAWRVNFGDGSDDAILKTDFGTRVRLVRGGQF